MGKYLVAKIHFLSQNSLPTNQLLAIFVLYKSENNRTFLYELLFKRIFK